MCYLYFKFHWNPLSSLERVVLTRSTQYISLEKILSWIISPHNCQLVMILLHVHLHIMCYHYFKFHWKPPSGLGEVLLTRWTDIWTDRWGGWFLFVHINLQTEWQTGWIHLIWIFTVFKGNAYPSSTGQGLMYVMMTLIFDSLGQKVCQKYLVFLYFYLLQKYIMFSKAHRNTSHFFCGYIYIYIYMGQDMIYPVAILVYI